MEFIIKNAFYEATVSTYGAELISLKNADGRELLWQNNLGEGWNNHAPLLFPFCGRLKDKEFIKDGKAYPMKIHGFANVSEFDVSEKSDESVTLTLSANEETRAIFPYGFKLSAVYTLSGDKLTLKVTVENTGDEILPFVFGWHPGFNLPTEDGQDINDYAVKFMSERSELSRAVFTSDLTVPGRFEPYPIENSEYKLCEDEIYARDTMVFRDTGSDVKLYAKGHPFELNMSWSDNLPVLCIWKMPKNDAKYICIEPWTHSTARGERSNDIDVRPMIRLGCGESEDFKYSLQFKF